MRNTAVLKCNCKHNYQDKRYGKGKRVMNYSSKSSSTSMRTYRCTVCESLTQLRSEL